MRKFYTKEDLLEDIDSLTIYDDEYDIICFLLENVSGNFFVRILEEIFNKEISFTDFNQMFPNQEYRQLLESVLPVEQKLKERIDRYKEFKNSLAYNKMIEYNDEIEYKTNNMIISDKAFSNELYTDEVKRMRNGLLYSLFDGINGDPILVQTVKQTLIDFLKNKYKEETITYTLVNIKDYILYETDAHLISLNATALDETKKKISDNTLFTGTIDDIWISDKEMLVSKDYTAGFKIRKLEPNEKVYKNAFGNLTIKDRNIYPQDILNKILFFAEKEMIPLETEYQILTREDQNFMLENGLNVEEVKKMKALATFIRKKHLEV